jgi:hypothetical protein
MRAPVGIVLVVGSRAVYAPRTSDQSCGLCSIACRAGASTRPLETRSHFGHTGDSVTLLAKRHGVPRRLAGPGVLWIRAQWSDEWRSAWR